MTQETNLISTGAAADRAEVSTQTIINWAEEGRFSFERVGKGPRRIHRDSFLAYLESQGLVEVVAQAPDANQTLVAGRLANAVMQAFLIRNGEIVDIRPRYAKQALDLAKQYMEIVRGSLQQVDAGAPRA